MRHRSFALIAATAAVAVLVAACGGATAPSAAAPTENIAPDVSGGIPSSAAPSFNADTDLEALLPSTFGGVTLQKLSVKGAESLGQDPTSDFNQMVIALGLDAADVSVAVAADAAGKLEVQFDAVRFAGADSARLLEVFQAAAQASGDLVGSVNIGGRDVIKMRDSVESYSYFYVRNDVVLGITVMDDAAAANALAVLP